MSILIQLLSQRLVAVRASLPTPGQNLVHGWYESQDNALLDWYFYLNACAAISCDLCYWFVSGVLLGYVRFCFFFCLSYWQLWSGDANCTRALRKALSCDGMKTLTTSALSFSLNKHHCTVSGWKYRRTTRHCGTRTGKRERWKAVPSTRGHGCSALFPWSACVVVPTGAIVVWINASALSRKCIQEKPSAQSVHVLV